MSEHESMKMAKRESEEKSVKIVTVFFISISSFLYHQREFLHIHFENNDEDNEEKGKN